MFELESNQTHVETRPEEVIDIYTSINRPTVAPPDRPPEPAQAFISTVYDQGNYQVYIYLYLANSNTGLLYRWSEGAVPGEQVSGIYQSAFQFAESMGFMIDDMRFRDKSPEEKASIYEETPMFHADLSFMKSADAEGEADVEELVIESLDESEPEEIALESEDAEEINLDVLGDQEDLTPQESDGVEEITLGGDDIEAEEVTLGADSPEEDALDALEMIEEGPAEPEAAEAEPLDAGDDLLEGLEMEETAPAIEETAEVEAAFEGLEDEAADEQTIEAEPIMEAVMEPEPAVPEEEALTPEEAKVLGGVDERPPPVSPPPRAATPPPAAAEVEIPAGISKKDYEILVRFLAMM